MRYCSYNAPGAEVYCYTNSAQLPDTWDNFIPEGHFLQRQQLAITEAANLPDMSFNYVLISKQGVPVAAAYFQVLSLKDKHINRQQVKPWQGFVWNSFTSLANPKLLIAGHLFRHDVSSFYWQQNIPPYDAYQYYQSAINEAMQRSCANAILIKDVPEALVKYFQHHAPQYILLRNDIYMELDIPESWHSISDYEKALKHKYAQRFRKIRQSWKELEIKELSVTDVRTNKDILYKLYRRVSDNQQVRIGFLSPEYMVLLKENYDPELKVWGIYEGEEMVGFFSAWVKEDVFDMFYIGFDYDSNARLQLYFNILFFGIEQAIAFRKQKLILGRTALDAKARAGCKARYLSTFLYISNSLIRNRIMRIQQSTSDKEGAWEERHPFKTSV